MAAITNKKTKANASPEDQKKLIISLLIAFALILIIALFAVDLGCKMAEPPELSREDRLLLYEAIRNETINVLPSKRTEIAKFMDIGSIKEIRFDYEGLEDKISMWFIARGGAKPLVFNEGSAHLRGEEYMMYLLKEKDGDELRLRRISDGVELALPIRHLP